MNLSSIVSGVLNVANQLLPALQGTPAGAVVNAGKAIIDLIDNVKADASSTDQAALSAKRDELEPLVLAHLDRTIASLD